jgi:hypothetical protein
VGRVASLAADCVDRSHVQPTNSMDRPRAQDDSERQNAMTAGSHPAHQHAHQACVPTIPRVSPGCAALPRPRTQHRVATAWHGRLVPSKRSSACPAPGWAVYLIQGQAHDDDAHSSTRQAWLGHSQLTAGSCCSFSPWSPVPFTVQFGFSAVRLSWLGYFPGRVTVRWDPASPSGQPT